MAKPKRNKKGRFVKSGGKRKTKRKSPKRRAAAKKRVRNSKGRFVKRGGSKRKTGGKRRSAAKRTSKRGRAKGRGGRSMGSSRCCGRVIFGGAKGLATHRRRHH